MDPVIQRVGCTPIEYISLIIVEANNVRIPEGRGTVITIAKETNMAVQIKPLK